MLLSMGITYSSLTRTIIFMKVLFVDNLPTFRIKCSNPRGEMKLDCRDSLPKLRTSGKLIGSSQCACLVSCNCVGMSLAGAAHAGPTLYFLNVAIQQSGSSYPLSVEAHVLGRRTYA